METTSKNLEELYKGIPKKPRSVRRPPQSLKARIAKDSLANPQGVSQDLEGKIKTIGLETKGTEPSKRMPSSLKKKPDVKAKNPQKESQK